MGEHPRKGGRNSHPSIQFDDSSESMMVMFLKWNLWNQDGVPDSNATRQNTKKPKRDSQIREISTTNEPTTYVVVRADETDCLSSSRYLWACQEIRTHRDVFRVENTVLVGRQSFSSFVASPFLHRQLNHHI